MCPWPRLQGAIWDPEAFTVNYRDYRGEQRTSAKKAAELRLQGQPAGDCVDCHQCVTVCPIGIDIREGPNFACINCGLCVDACDSVMSKLGRPRGLIDYESWNNIERGPRGEPRVSRLVRGVVLSLREQPYVDAAVAAGTRTPMIILRHILPNTLAPMTVQATFICASAMIVESILSFIGAGTPPNIPSWGNIMAEGRALWQVKPFIVFFPAVFLSLTVLAVNLLGDGLRDMLDPRMAKRL